MAEILYILFVMVMVKYGLLELRTTIVKVIELLIPNSKWNLQCHITSRSRFHTFFYHNNFLWNDKTTGSKKNTFFNLDLSKK